MNSWTRDGALSVVFLTVAGCLLDTMVPLAIEKSAIEDELRKETVVGVAIPQGCPAVKTTVPAGQSSIVVSYREPMTDQRNLPISRLAYTTIYLIGDGGKPTAIRVWTNNALGGSNITIRDIPVPGPAFGVCVTATDWAGKESPPAFPEVRTPTP